jgi:hypothetical protein
MKQTCFITCWKLAHLCWIIVIAGFRNWTPSSCQQGLMQQLWQPQALWQGQQQQLTQQSQQYPLGSLSVSHAGRLRARNKQIAMQRFAPRSCHDP